MNLDKISRRLSYLLRHCKEPVYVDLDGGWVPVDVILRVLGEQFNGFVRDSLDRIVASDEKGRYSFDDSGERIRANQGHSIPGIVVEMRTLEPPEILYHGTATRFLDDILRDGLKPMSRQYVHISRDYDTAVNVGKRHGTPVVLQIEAKRFVSDGHELYCSANGIWQARHVPVRYFAVCSENDNLR